MWFPRESPSCMNIWHLLSLTYIRWFPLRLPIQMGWICSASDSEQIWAVILLNSVIVLGLIRLEKLSKLTFSLLSAKARNLC